MAHVCNSRPGFETLDLGCISKPGLMQTPKRTFSGSRHAPHPFLTGKECSQGFVKEKAELSMFPGAVSELLTRYRCNLLTLPLLPWLQHPHFQEKLFSLKSVIETTASMLVSSLSEVNCPHLLYSEG